MHFCSKGPLSLPLPYPRLRRGRNKHICNMSHMLLFLCKQANTGTSKVVPVINCTPAFQGLLCTTCCNKLSCNCVFLIMQAAVLSPQLLRKQAHNFLLITARNASFLTAPVFSIISLFTVFKHWLMPLRHCAVIIDLLLIRV